MVEIEPVILDRAHPPIVFSIPVLDIPVPARLQIYHHASE
jgi:hypothetical protein